MRDFHYVRPQKIDDAVRILRKDAEAKCLAGGMTFVPTLKQRLASPSCVIDLGLVLNRDIKTEGDFFEIGAGARHADVARHPEIKRRLPALAKLADGIGDPMVRNRGTIGGSVANNDPAADYPAALLGLGAEIITTSRKIEAEEFITGMYETALAHDEIITAIRFPVPRRAGYRKMKNKASGYAVAGVFIADFLGGPRVGVTGAKPQAYRDISLEQALATDFSEEALRSWAPNADDLLDDLSASPDYRGALLKVAARDAILMALGR